jgi:hypothetical protein
MADSFRRGVLDRFVVVIREAFVAAGAGGAERPVEVVEQRRDLGRLQHRDVHLERGALERHELRVGLHEFFDLLARQPDRIGRQWRHATGRRGGRTAGIHPHGNASITGRRKPVRRLCEEHYPNSKFGSTSFRQILQFGLIPRATRRDFGRNSPRAGERFRHP